MSTDDFTVLKGRLRFVVPSVVALAAFIISIFLYFLPYVKEIGTNQKKDSIQQLVQLPIQIFASFEQKRLNGKLTDEEARWEASELVRNLRYGPENKDYFWILDTRPVLIMHPYRTDLEGTDVSEYSDKNGTYLFTEMAEIAREQGKGFVSYYWQVRDMSEEVERKLSYISFYEPWGWIIGTGLYIDEVDAELSGVTRSMLFVSIGVGLFVALLLVLMIRQGFREQIEKIEAFAALKKSKDRYKNLVTIMQEGIIVQDKEGLFRYVNPRFCSFIGVPEEELIGRRVLDFIADEDRDRFMQEMEKRRRGIDDVYQISWKSAEAGAVVSIVSPRLLFDLEGRPDGSFAVVTDISELKKAEERLRRLLQEKTVLLQEVHHRVKNNLQLITSLLSLQYREIEDKRVKSVLTDSQGRIQTMSRIHELLYESDNFRDIPMRVFLEQLVSDIKGVYAESGEASIQFEIMVDNVDMSVDRAVPAGLIMNELISNAVKHAFPEGVFSAGKKRISLFFIRENQKIRFGVEDNGIGFRSDSDSTAGTGLGMELVSILTEQLGGTVEYGPGQDGRGARIVVYVPFQSQRETALYAV